MQQQSRYYTTKSLWSLVEYKGRYYYHIMDRVVQVVDIKTGTVLFKLGNGTVPDLEEFERWGRDQHEAFMIEKIMTEFNQLCEGINKLNNL
jgi:hypothetical protein